LEDRLGFALGERIRKIDWKMSEIDENEDWDNYGEIDDEEDDWDYGDDDDYHDEDYDNLNLDNFNYDSEHDDEKDEFDKNLEDDINNNVFINDVEVHNFFHNNLRKQEKIENRRNKNKNNKENNKIIVENINNNSKLIIDDEFKSDSLSNKSLDECGSLINKLKTPTHVFEDVQDTNEKVDHGDLFLNVYNRNEKQVSGVKEKSINNNNNINNKKKHMIKNNNNNNNNNMKDKNNNKMNKVIDRYKSKYLSSAASDVSGKCNDLSVSDIVISGNKKCPFPTVTSVPCKREILTAAGSSEIFLNSTLLDSENLH